LIVFDDRLTRFGTGFDYFEGREALHAEAAAERFVGLFIAVYGCYFCQAGEGIGSFFVGGLQVLAMAAPWSIEFNDL
jgi:hypothetical protein